MFLSQQGLAARCAGSSPTSIPIACCVGLPLIAAAGISVGLAAWAGGIAFAALVLIAAATLLVLRCRSSWPLPAARSPAVSRVAR